MARVTPSLALLYPPTRIPLHSARVSKSIVSNTRRGQSGLWPSGSPGLRRARTRARQGAPAPASLWPMLRWGPNPSAPRRDVFFHARQVLPMLMRMTLVTIACMIRIKNWIVAHVRTIVIIVMAAVLLFLFAKPIRPTPSTPERKARSFHRGGPIHLNKPSCFSKRSCLCGPGMFSLRCHARVKASASAHSPCCSAGGFAARTAV